MSRWEESASLEFSGSKADLGQLRLGAHWSQWLSNCRGRLPVTRMAHEDRLRQGFQSSLVPHILESQLLSVGIFLPVPPVKRHFPSRAFTTPGTWFLGHSRSFSLSVLCLPRERSRPTFQHHAGFRPIGSRWRSVGRRRKRRENRTWSTPRQAVT